MLRRKPRPVGRRRVIAVAACVLWLLAVEVLPGLHLAFHADDHTHAADGAIVHRGGAHEHDHDRGPLVVAEHEHDLDRGPLAVEQGHDHDRGPLVVAEHEHDLDRGPLAVEQGHDHDRGPLVVAEHEHDLDRGPLVADHGHDHGPLVADHGHDHGPLVADHGPLVAEHDHDHGPLVAEHDHDHGPLVAVDHDARGPLVAAPHEHEPASPAEHSHDRARSDDHATADHPHHHGPRPHRDRGAFGPVLDHDPTGHAAAGIAHHAIALHRPPPPLLEPLPALRAVWRLERTAEQAPPAAAYVPATARGPPATA